MVKLATRQRTQHSEREMEHMETVYEVVFDRCGTATTKRATFISKDATYGVSSHSEREVMPRERRSQSAESSDRRSRSGARHARVALDLRTSRGRRHGDYVDHTFHVSV